MKFTASVNLTLDSGVMIKGSVHTEARGRKRLHDGLCEYFLEEVWHDGSTIIDFEMTSCHTMKQIPEKFIKPGTTLDDDQAIYGHDYTPFKRYRIIENYV